MPKKKKECTSCACFYDNNPEDTEVGKIMAEAGIECSLEREEVFTNAGCIFWQKVGK
jgi:hypothetical protein